MAPLPDLAGQQAAGPFDRPPHAGLRLHPGLLAAVFLGGCAGGLARHQVVQAWPAPAHVFPWATFVINCSGAFALALLLVLLLELLPSSTYVRPLLGTGFCGAWTTFSSVVVAADQLVAHGHVATGATYVLASIGGGLASAALGLLLGRAVAARRHPTDERERR